MLKFDILYDRVTATLEAELPAHLAYHNLEHTKYVLDKAILIGQKECVNGEDLLLIKIAALYHDIGFIQSRENHEEIGCTIVHDQLSNDQVHPKAIAKICGMIRATKIPQKPLNHLEKIIADADLEYLGTGNFEPTSERLFEELKYFNNKLTRKQWYGIQVDFLNAHKYHTQFCKNHREPIKCENLKKLRAQLEDV